MTKIIPQGLCVSAFLSCALTFTTTTAHGATSSPCEPAVLTLIEAAELLRIDAVKMQRLAEHDDVPARLIGASWRFNCDALMAWLNGDWERIVTVAPTSELGSALAGRDMGELTATGTLVAQAETTPSVSEPSPADTQDEPIGEAPEERTAEDIFLRTQRVLLGPGDMTFDFGQFYSESNGQPLVSVDGGAALATIEQEALITTVQGRIGVGEETELFVGTSYFNVDSDVFFGSEKLASAGRSEFGDVRFGVRRTLLKEGLGRPNIIATLNGHIPTGDTSSAIGGGLSFVKSVDPVALFASVNYTHTFSEDFADVSLLEPEDRLDASVGFALALNDTLSLSTSVSGVFTGATRFPNAVLRQQDGYSLGFGLTSWLARGIYIEPSLSFSLGGPGDSFAFGLSLFTYTP